MRIAAPAPEEHIDCPEVTAFPQAGTPVTYLRASPELQMKKLLSAGMEKIYQIGPCFREGERGSRHRSEFTMLEWYRKDADYRDILRDTVELMSALIGKDAAGFEYAELGVREAYRRFADWDPWENWDADHFDFDMATKIEPAIKEMGGIVFLKDYPVPAASLAKLGGEDAQGRFAAFRSKTNGKSFAFFSLRSRSRSCRSQACRTKMQAARFPESTSRM